LKIYGKRRNVTAFIETGTEKELEGIQIVVTIHMLFIVEKDDVANGYI